MWGLTAATAMMVAAGLALAGCGGGDADAPARAAPPAGRAESSAETPAAPAAAPDPQPAATLAAGGVGGEPSFVPIWLGMDRDAAERKLVAQGFEKTQGDDHHDCEFAKGRQTLTIKTGGGKGSCPPGPVSVISYSHPQDSFDPAPLIAEVRRRFGDVCSKAAYKGCETQNPRGAPLVKSLSVGYGAKTGYSVEVEAVDNVEAKSGWRPAQWWDKAIMAADPRDGAPKIVGSEKFASVDPADRPRLKRMGEAVYDYCASRETFAALHDCRCVAGKYLDAQIARDEAHRVAGVPIDKTEQDSITIADQVADQCPNPPGAAWRAYRQCKSNYRSQLGDDLQAFCLCYADETGKAMRRQAEASMPAVTARGVSAIQACHDKGVTTPLDH